MGSNKGIKEDESPRKEAPTLGKTVLFLVPKDRRVAWSPSVFFKARIVARTMDHEVAILSS